MSEVLRINDEELVNEEPEVVPVEEELEIPEEKDSSKEAIIVAALAVYGGYKLGKKGGKLAVKGFKKGKAFIHFIQEKLKKKEEEPEVVTGDIVEVTKVE